MTKKLNCWQFMNCGREKGGLLAGLSGECPVSTFMKYDGYNDGVGAGRACWMVPDSVCRRDLPARRRTCPCHNCDFYQRVMYEEGEQVSFSFSTTSIPTT